MSAPSATIVVSLLITLFLLVGAHPLSARVLSDNAVIEELVEQYVLAADKPDDERVSARKPLLEFKYRVINKRGGYLLFNESDWEAWERRRSGGEPLTAVEVVGRPVILEAKDPGKREVLCAVRISTSKSSPEKESVIFRRFGVRSTGDHSWRISEERSLAHRAGSEESFWKEFKRIPAKDKTVLLRTSPLEKRNNVIRTLKPDSKVKIWVQRDQQWLVAEEPGGAVGFLNRDQISWEDGEKTKKPAPGLQGRLVYALPVPGRKGYVFNPHTNGLVNVKGVPGGMLVRDPNDPNPNRVFRVPFSEPPGRALVVQE